MILAPAVIVWTSRPARSRLFLVPEDLDVPAVVRQAAAVRARWSEPEPLVLARMATEPARHVSHA